MQTATMHSCANSDSFYGKNTVCSVERLPAFTMGWLKTGVSRNNDRVSYKKYRSSSGNQMHVFRNRCALPHFLHRVNWSWMIACRNSWIYCDHWVYGFRCCCSKIETHCYLNRASCRIEISWCHCVFLTNRSVTPVCTTFIPFTQ